MMLWRKDGLLNMADNFVLISFSVLEFYAWPAHWDHYLGKMLEKRLNKK